MSYQSPEVPHARAGHVVVLDAVRKTVELALGDDWSILLVNERGRHVLVEYGVVPDGAVPDHWHGDDALRVMLCRGGVPVGMIEEVRLERTPQGGFKVLILPRTFTEYASLLMGGRREETLWTAARRGAAALLGVWAQIPSIIRWTIAAVAGTVVAALVARVGLV